MTVVLSRTEFLATLDRKRIAAGALIRDAQGRVCLVEPTYKPALTNRWILPGGTIEADESPADGLARELVEELGLALPVGRALAMEWQREDDDPDGALLFAYDGGVVDDATAASFRLPADELASFRFVPPDEVADLATPGTTRRVAAALRALDDGTFVEVER